jgi:hypothetical protein
MADPGILAVACVVDSSLTLAAEWSLILTEYISPLLKRLSEVYLGYQVLLPLLIDTFTFVLNVTSFVSALLHMQQQLHVPRLY